MTTECQRPALSEIDLRIALNEMHPERNFGAISIDDQRDSLEAYWAYEDGTLAEAPYALAAYVQCQRNACA